jgi:hypothetical protein
MNKLAFCLFIFTGCCLAQCNMVNEPNTGNLTVTPGECLPDIEDRFVYPAVYGTEEWISASGEEKERLLQLPEDRIKSLSSYALISSLLDKPGIWSDYALSSNSSPVATCDRFIFSKHNSVPEFEKRNDRVQSLLSYYAAVSPDCYESLQTEEQMTFAIQLCVLEVWFIRDAILHTMNSAQKKQTVTLLLQKHEQKQSYGNATMDAMAWIMYEDRYSPLMKHYKGATLSKEYSFFDRRDDIISFAKSYIR